MTTSPAPVRVLVVADDPLARTGLATLLAAQPGCAVVGQTESAPGLSDALMVFRPDVVVWDLGWDTVRMLERLADLRDLGVPVVALAPDEASASQAWVSGARSILIHPRQRRARGRPRGGGLPGRRGGIPDEGCSRQRNGPRRVAAVAGLTEDSPRAGREGPRLKGLLGRPWGVRSRSPGQERPVHQPKGLRQYLRQGNAGHRNLTHTARTRERRASWPLPFLCFLQLVRRTKQARQEPSSTWVWAAPMADRTAGSPGPPAPAGTSCRSPAQCSPGCTPAAGTSSCSASAGAPA
ncbi:MAG: response regulator transcription factor [Dehalococcoidia bacterium]|nr:response regulator transcription factor [Dehalococcoidia bacterium]